MAKVDPENTCSFPPFQLSLAEAADVQMSKLMVLAIDQWRVNADPKKHLENLETSLCTIAKDRKLADPKLQARAIRKELVRRIDYHRSSIARNWRYGRFVESGEHQSKRSDTWLCYVIRYTNNRRKLGQRRGSKSIGNPASARKEAAAQASTIKTRDQLTPVEQRVFDLLKGDRRKLDKHPIEKRAIQLAKAVEDEWVSRRQKGRPKGKWTRKPYAEAPSFEALKPSLMLTDLVSIAAPVIEEFAGKITRRSNAFTALCHIVCAYSEVIDRDTPGRKLSIKRKYLGNAETVATTSGQRDENALPYAVQEALSRVRRAMKNPYPNLIRIEDSTAGP